MKPSQVAQVLLHIATNIDKAKQPDKNLVVRDIKKILAAVRVAEQEITSVPVKHDMSLPLFESEEHENDLEKLSELAKALVDGVRTYLESMGEKMGEDGSIAPGELEGVMQQQPDHLAAICNELLGRALNGGDEEEEEEEPVEEEPVEEEPVEE